MDATTSAAPTAGKIVAIGSTQIILTLAKAAAGFAVGQGWFGASKTEMVSGAIVIALTYGWSFWNDYGKVMAKASLDILRAKILDAAAKANQSSVPQVPAAQLAQLAAHVVMTTPAAGPAGPAEQSASVKAAVAIAIAFGALALGWSSPLYAASANAPTLTKMPTSRPAAAAPASPSGKITQASAQQNPLLVLQAFTLSDAQAALADANGQTPPDTVAAACYTAIIAMLGNPLSDPLPQQPGLFIAYQKARDAKAFLSSIQSPTGPLAPLNQACAPLVLDAQQTLIGLGVATGVIAATATAGGAPLLALPALPSLSALLPIP